MKLLKRTTDLLMLQVSYGFYPRLLMVCLVMIGLYVVFLSKSSIWFSLVVLSLVFGSGFGIMYGAILECWFDKTDDSLTLLRFALFSGRYKRYILSDINYVNINRHSRRYSLTLQTNGADIVLQSSLSRKNANTFAQQIGVFLDIPYTKAFLD